MKPGKIYMARGDKQMKLRRLDKTTVVIEHTDDPPESFCIPSVDYLFRSVAEVYKEKTLGVVMTGIGKDGTEGLRLLKEQGGVTIAQDEASSLVYGMPKSAIEAKVVDHVVLWTVLSQLFTQV